MNKSICLVTAMSCILVALLIAADAEKPLGIVASLIAFGWLAEKRGER